MNARVNVFRIFVFKHWIRCREKWCGGLAKRPFLKKDVDLEKYSVQETKFHSSHTTCSKFGPLIIYFRQMAQLIRKPLKTFAVLRWMIAVFPFVSVGGFFLLEGVFPSHHCKVLDCWALFTLQCEATWDCCFLESEVMLSSSDMSACTKFTGKTTIFTPGHFSQNQC